VGRLCLKLKRVRSEVRAWARACKLQAVYLLNCHAIISFLPKLEEIRNLSDLELRLRFLAKGNLSQRISDKATYWQQLANIKICILGYENTRYFHLCASGCLQKNQIKNMDDHDGNVVFSHQAKAEIVHGFFKNLLGTLVHAKDSLDWTTLATSTSLTPSQANTPVRAFSLEDILDCSLLHER
jgi:hypothetical protein